jgi:hypothetical protein
VNRKSIPPIPEAIVQLQRQLDQFRSTQPQRTKLPEPLWQATVELARQHGIYAVAHPAQGSVFYCPAALSKGQRRAARWALSSRSERSLRSRL